MLRKILDLLRVLAGQLPFETDLYEVPGIGTGAAYASGDAFGTGFWVTVPPQGYLDSMTFFDLDNEGIAKTIYLFKREVTVSADNAAFAPVAADMRGRPLQINLTAADYVTHSGGQMATVTAIGLPYEAPGGRLWCRLVTRGADNIAAGALPLISFGGRRR